MKVAVVGAGVAGLCCATELQAHGFELNIYEAGDSIGESACSWFAGGMLAPWCERENAEQAVLVHGQQALGWWRNHCSSVSSNGSLVVAQPRDRVDLKRFAERTSAFVWVDAATIRQLEPDLTEHFNQGLYFKGEGHLHPRTAIQELASRLQAAGAKIHFGQRLDPNDLDEELVFDCRGYSAKEQWPDLRGVKGEMLILHSADVRLQRPVRMLHPRIPLYVVPRDEGYFMVGATMLESSDRNGISARSMLELLNGAYALHPAFAEAEIVEIGVDVRPAFGDNLPRLQREGKVIRVNGLYRHGFLLGPALAQRALRAALNPHTPLESFSCS